ncbi:SRF-type transcription factor (DNA-binding and dimerization domain)-domain-containing protein [Syncephalastrum racemosum]|uniref:SRF-type transcription factor (DNA-binding and dimerization domain)-domain-containing protein n=1 Tax=Syncephalastrum racemosum TaxID=13706 RepID=A0A1X2H798_SYNRA|nr:SRF-type transcription factor (DNA-binding and dimerization domain)-domain-containing protein [Syncephalastrum racemosum]
MNNLGHLPATGLQPSSQSPYQAAPMPLDAQNRAPTMISNNNIHDDGDSDSEGKPEKRSGRRKIKIEFIEDKSRRHITFSKRKAGIMKKAYELSTLTGTQVLLLVVSETGLVYTFTTPKLQPLVSKPEGKNLIQACLNAPDPAASTGSGADIPSSSPRPTSASMQGTPNPTYGNVQMTNYGYDNRGGGGGGNAGNAGASGGYMPSAAAAAVAAANPPYPSYNHPQQQTHASAGGPGYYSASTASHPHSAASPIPGAHPQYMPQGGNNYWSQSTSGHHNSRKD